MCVFFSLFVFFLPARHWARHLKRRTPSPNVDTGGTTWGDAAQHKGEILHGDIWVSHFHERTHAHARSHARTQREQSSDVILTGALKIAAA